MSREKSIRILWFAGHTISTQSRSGIQRVIIDAANALHKCAILDIVKWDYVDGQLRYADAHDLRSLFGAKTTCPNNMCHRRQYRFGDTISHDNETWLIFPEIPFHLENGNQVFSSILSQCREYRVRTAVVYYDLIPLRVKEYQRLRPQHEEYTNLAFRADLIFTISSFTKNDLSEFAAENVEQIGPLGVQELTKKIVPLPLGGEGSQDTGVKAALKNLQSDTIVLVGTVEPRKLQTRFLRVFNDACIKHPDLKRLKIDVFGSLHELSSDALQVELGRNHRIRYHKYADNDAIKEAYSRALFSAFPSKYEGYGLPIVESLEHGVPCITANFGAMAEIGSQGGCLLVNVNDDKAVEDAIIRLVNDKPLYQQLQTEISQRKFRTWDDYARDLVRHLSAFSSAVNIHTFDAWSRFEKWLGNTSPDATDHFDVAGIQVTLKNIAPSQTSAINHCFSRDLRMTIQVARLLPEQKAKISLELLGLITASHFVIVPNRQVLDLVVASANDLGIDVPLPRHIILSSEGANVAEVYLKALLSEKLKQLEARASESTFSQCYVHERQHRPDRPYKLAVVISTYNRADFVSMNVEWILRHIKKNRLPVICVVVDNASTDNTRLKLKRFSRHPNYLYVCNPQNVGMLGNLRNCANLLLAEHTWITGDDDFILPGALERTLLVLSEKPSIPFVFHNFAVYCREKVMSMDSASLYVSSGIPVGVECSQSGSYPIYQIAGEHDNLFTAIYPIVFRSDIAAACFNHTFRGIPFSNLIESIPTTDIILGTYSSVEAHWFKEIGVVGNAHNSWSANRPRWHSVIMPMALAKARDAGVDPTKIWKWMRIHRSLFDEAINIAMSNHAEVHIGENDLDDYYPFFREALKLPPHLLVNDHIKK
jgi:glycosyltransferase involved in cell wall biosynthesis